MDLPEQRTELVILTINCHRYSSVKCLYPAGARQGGVMNTRCGDMHGTGKMRLTVSQRLRSCTDVIGKLNVQAV